MTLNTTDLDYIKHRMDTYDIKYQEIYDEIYDHIISAVETARAGGDERNIVPLFDELMERQFPGYWAFETISKQYEKAYHKKIRAALWINMKSYFTLQTVPLFVLSVLIGFYLPQNRVVSLFFMIGLILAAFIPYFYVLRGSRVIKTTARKKSLVKNHVTTRAFMLLALVNVILNLVGMVGRDYHINYLNPRYFHPVVYILLISFFIIYGLSCVRLSKQEFKLADHTI